MRCHEKKGHNDKLAQKRTYVGVEILEELIQSELAQSLRTVTLCNRGNMTYPRSEQQERNATYKKGRNDSFGNAANSFALEGFGN